MTLAIHNEHDDKYGKFNWARPKDYIVIDSLTRMEEYVAKARKITNKRLAKPIKDRKPKKLPPGKYRGIVTKAQMLERIKELEGRIDANNLRHDKAINDMRLSFATDIGKIHQRFAEGLLEAQVSGMKECSWPRRS